MGLLTTASHWRNGDAELPLPPRQYVLGKPRHLPVVESPHDIGLYADLNREEEMLDDHEWQAERIVGERQTSSGLEYEVSVQKTL